MHLDCGVDSVRSYSLMTILALLDSQKSVAFWYVTNSSQRYQEKHSRETLAFLDYFEDDGNKNFRNFGTYSPSTRRQISENQSPHIDNLLAKVLEKSQERYLNNTCIKNADTDTYFLAIYIYIYI
jgi:hypothetical protein